MCYNSLFAVVRSGIRVRMTHLILCRHLTAYNLANVGQDTRSIQAYLGHRSIVSTKRYTALAPDSGQPIGIPVRRTERKILSLGITELAQSFPKCPAKRLCVGTRQH